MKHPYGLIRAAFLAVLVSVLVPLSAQGGGRVALVLGNSAYADKPLANPVNDARDMAALLERAGFQVLVRTDQDLAGMENALADFGKALAGKESALFYYAGHGVQVNGENYLIPVREDIRNEVSARSRGVSMAQVLDVIRSSGVSTGLVFLDACRDNPFVGGTRSTTRGLGVVAAPREFETLVAYATEPGDTAEDGKGRNGVFTQALLKNLAVEGRSLTDAMIQVRADVKAQTADKQRPRTDNGLSRQYYLFDPSAGLAAQARLLASAEADLAALDKELAAIKTRIAAAASTKEREALELEQKRQAALQKARAEEKERILAEAERLQKIKATNEALALQEARTSSVALQKQQELAAVASQKRKELEKVMGGDLLNDPVWLVNQVDEAARALAELSGQAEASWKTIEADVNKYYDTRLAAVDKVPGKVETDQEFEARTSRERNDLAAARTKELADKRRSFDQSLGKNTQDLQRTLDERVRRLEAGRWTRRGAQVVLSPYAYDRNRKIQSFDLESLDPAFPFKVRLDKDLSKSTQLLADFENLDASIRAGALLGEIVWRISWDRSGGRFWKTVESARVWNVVNGETVASMPLGRPVSWFLPGKLDSPVRGTVRISVSDNSSKASILVDGVMRGNLPLELELPVKSYQVEVRFEGGKGAWSNLVVVGQGSNPPLVVPAPWTPPPAVGPANPDGGSGYIADYDVSAFNFYYTGMLGFDTAPNSQDLASGFGMGFEAVGKDYYVLLAADYTFGIDVGGVLLTRFDLGIPLYLDSRDLALVPMVGIFGALVNQEIPWSYYSQLSMAYPDVSMTAWAGMLGLDTGLALRLELDRESVMSFALRWRLVEPASSWDVATDGLDLLGDTTTLSAAKLKFPAWTLPPISIEIGIGFQESY